MNDDPTRPGEAPLICKQCRGALALPEDLEAVSTRCPFCGKQALLPEHIVETRQQRAAVLRRERQAAATLAAEAERRVARRRAGRRRLVIGLVVATVLVALAVLGVLWIVQATKDDRPRDPAYTGQNQVGQWLAALRAKGCSYMVAEPDVNDAPISWTMTMKADGDCINVLAATGVQSNALAVDMRTPFGQQVPAPAPSYFVHLVHCADTDGKYPVEVTPTNDYFYTFAAIGCPRSLYEQPRAADPVSTGLNVVAARMKQLYEAGCTHVLYPAEPTDVAFEWTPELSKSKQANCLQILAATGSATNILTMSMTTPFGEPVPVPAPAKLIDFLYCGETGGPHKVVFTPSDKDLYTFAAVDCPRNVARQLQKKR